MQKHLPYSSNYLSLITLLKLSNKILFLKVQPIYPKQHLIILEFLMFCNSPSLIVQHFTEIITIIQIHNITQLMPLEINDVIT